MIQKKGSEIQAASHPAPHPVPCLRTPQPWAPSLRLAGPAASLPAQWQGRH